MAKRGKAIEIVLIRIELEESLYLLLQCKSGSWDLCQGRLEKGETLKADCLHELWKETSVKST